VRLGIGLIKGSNKADSLFTVLYREPSSASDQQDLDRQSPKGRNSRGASTLNNEKSILRFASANVCSLDAAPRAVVSLFTDSIVSNTESKIKVNDKRQNQAGKGLIYQSERTS
jgi:hypothetical protein